MKSLSVAVALMLAVCCTGMELQRRSCTDRSDRCEQFTAPLCYDAQNNMLCCATCRSFYQEQDNGECPYGDRLTLIRREDQKFTCASYITWFGSWNCQSDPDIAHHCCGTCRPHMDEDWQ